MRSMKECVESYLMNHKRPVTVKQLAKYFIASDSGIYRAIRELDEEGKISTIKGKPLKYMIR